MRAPYRLGILAGLVMLACMHAPGPARAEEPAVDGPGFYAGRDAAWWVEELRGAGTSRAAYEALKIIGAPAFPALAQVVDHHDPTLRDMALTLLREIPGDLRVVAPQLGLALERATNEDSAQKLLGLVSRLGPDGASLAARVVPFLASENANLRGQALSTLERTGGDAAVLVPPLRVLLAAPDAGSHASALKVLAKLGPGAAPALPEVLKILGAAGDEPTQPARRNRNRDREVQAIAVLRTVGRIGAEGLRVLAALVMRPDLGLAQSAAEALARLTAREPEAAAVLVGCLTSGEEASRSAALQALATLQPLPQAAHDVLLAMLAAEDPLAANQALSLLERIELPVEPLTRALVRAASRPACPPGVQRAWARLLSESADAAILALPGEPVPLPTSVLLGLLEQVHRVGAVPARLKALSHLAAWARSYQRPDEIPPTLETAMVTLVGSSPQAWETLEPLLLGGSLAVAQLVSGVVARAESLRPHVLVLLASNEPAKRRTALSILARQQSTFTPEQDAALVRALEDPVLELRELSARILLGGVSRGSRDSAQRPAEVQARLHAVILDALRAPEPPRRAWAVGGVHGFLPPSQEAIDALLPLLADETLGEAFQGVAQALARAAAGREQATCARLLAELDAPEALRRAGAALALATLACHKERLLAALPALLAAESPGARARALRAVRVSGATSPEIEAGVRALIRSAELQVGVEALRVLPLVAKDLPATRVALLEVARDASRSWRAEAVTTLGQLGALAAEDLVDLMADPALRSTAIHALRTLGPAAHDVLPRLQTELGRTPEDRTLVALVDSLTRAPGLHGR